MKDSDESDTESEDEEDKSYQVYKAPKISAVPYRKLCAYQANTFSN